MLSTIYAYTFAFTFTTVLLIYLLKLPYLITGEVDLVNTYYGSNYRVNLPLDFLLISVYLSLATIANRYFEYTQLWQKIGIVALITMLISGSFYWIFTSYPKTSHFFSQWFHTVGFNAVLYDIVFVGITFIVYHFLKSTFERKKIL
jgi:hypothetical protein